MLVRNAGASGIEERETDQPARPEVQQKAPAADRRSRSARRASDDHRSPVETPGEPTLSLLGRKERAPDALAERDADVLVHEEELKAYVTLRSSVFYRARVTRSKITLVTMRGDVRHLFRDPHLAEDDGHRLLLSLLNDQRHQDVWPALLEGLSQEMSIDSPTSDTCRPIQWLRNVMVVVGRTSRSVRVAGYLSNVTIEKLDMRYRQRTAALIRLGEMAAGMAHELTQPLSAITFVAEGMMERIRRGNVDAAWVGTTADRIAGSAKRAIKLVDHIRAFGRNERQPLSPASWSEALAGALEILAPRLRRYVIDDQVAPDLPLIMGVPILMEQVLINLIGNAIDAYEGHDPESDADRRCVTVQAGVDGDVVSLRVSDRAGGIDPSVAGRLFEPFVTTKDPGKGTGLGLALCSETVMDMGGTLYVRNENGGAVFEVRVPRAVPEGFSARGC